MSTEFPIEWEGFTASERQRLRRLWSRREFSFPPEFFAQFSGKIYKGAAGEAGGFHFAANDLRVFREHLSGEVDFTSLENLADLTANLVTEFYGAVVRAGALSI
jgi:hypothetical protein